MVLPGRRGHHLPDAWAKLSRAYPGGRRGDLIAAYYRRLTGSDESERLRAALAWCRWEATTSYLVPNEANIREHAEPQRALALARIECHYFHHGTFFTSDNFLIENVGRIRHLPGVIVHGRYDLVCPMSNAWDLHHAWPEAALRHSGRRSHGDGNRHAKPFAGGHGHLAAALRGLTARLTRKNRMLN